jgi:hypothetical protein
MALSRCGAKLNEVVRAVFGFASAEKSALKLRIFNLAYRGYPHHAADGRVTA